MQKEIHPSYQDLTIIFPDGTEFVTKSTSKEGKLRLDVDFRNHPAWVGGVATVNTKAKKVEDFTSKYAGLTFGNKNTDSKK